MAGMASKRDRRLQGRLGTFLRQYARKNKNTPDSNDRQYDRELEMKIKQMSPEELDRLMRDGDSGE